ncbi:hypothetical protein CQW23_30040 [Capsicum baccatum]|uniref:Uncharacterized protein n=1 Tax=Capsicum baccatum TaxID=33114 RepID=A0A2G2VBN2_CAPBA|nr:hypothetical protein CQW23_30040 [Capsicum baccatum]
MPKSLLLNLRSFGMGWSIGVSGVMVAEEFLSCPLEETCRGVEGFDYSVHEDPANQFYLAIRKYYPGLKDGYLEPGYAGIRPKLFGPEEGPTDFVVEGEETHGISSLVNLFGIESPSLTFSMAITEHIAAKILK